jgi:hypothetical protein
MLHVVVCVLIAERCMPQLLSCGRLLSLFTVLVEQRQLHAIQVEHFVHRMR